MVECPEMAPNDALAPPVAALAPPAPPAALVRLSAVESERLRALLEAAWAPETRRVYRWGWRRWVAWCEATGRQALPAVPEEVAAFVAEAVAGEVVGAGGERSDRRSAPRTPSASAVRTILAAIRWAHETARLPSPTTSIEVKHAWKGASAKLGLAARNPKAPATMDVLERLLGTIDRATPAGKRDAAILLLGFHGAFRRSELAALRWRDVTLTPGGIAIHLPKSKTDQAGKGHTVGVVEVDDPPALCAVRALEEWKEAAAEGATGSAVAASSRIFGVSARTIARLVQRTARAARLDAATFGGHSLRAGFVTEAYRRGASDAEVAGTTRHLSATTLMRYRREADPIAQGASRRMKKPPRT